MQPIDPALMRVSGSTRSAVTLVVFTGLIAAAASVVQAGAAAAIIARVFLEGLGLAAVQSQIIVLAVAWIAKSAAVSVQDVWARQAGLRAAAELRIATARAYATTSAPAQTVLPLLTRGIDAVETYVSRYLPQLVLAVIVPVGLGGYILSRDVWTAVILAVTIPLIPAFMALIGWFTDGAVARQWQAVGRITDVINDLFAGLPDLVIFNRATAQAKTIKRLGADAADATMNVLRMSFLSALALELLATISVAIVAVGIGLRLVNGEMDLETGLLVLILAPDVYLPIRLVGTQFHAAVEGIEAWQQARPILEQHPVRTRQLSTAITRLEVSDLEVGYAKALIAPISFSAGSASLTAVVGPSGAGKTTLLRTIAGLQPPLSGIVQANGTDVHAIEERDWFSHIGYLSQDPWLGHGTVRDALTRGTRATDAECQAALAEVGLEELYLNTAIDDLGSGVSVGQRRRIALARYRLRHPQLLLLDEPTAAVDATSEERILQLIERCKSEGVIVVVVAHRPALLSMADNIVRVGA